MSLRILVTGSSGFVGSAVIGTLAEAGHSVRAASRKPTEIMNRDRIEWMRLPDLDTDFDWKPLLEGMDIVVHLAAIAHRSHRSRDYAQANRVATVNLAQACCRHDIKRLIFVSSIGAQTGSAADHVVSEQDEPCPVTAYDRAKLAAEEEIKRCGTPFTILRPVIIYGPGAKANIALIQRIATLPVPLPFGAFKNQRSLLSIENLTSAITFCLDSPQTLDQTFIVCDNEPITLADMLATLRKAAGRPPGMISIPPLAVRAVLIAARRQELWDRIGRELVASSAKLRKAGWSPRVETKDGLRAMVRASLGGSRSD